MCPPVMPSRPMQCPAVLPRSLTKKRATSCGPTTWRLFWRKRWKPFCGAACSTLGREIFMTPIYWRLRSPLIRSCLRKLCERHPGTEAPRNRLRMCRVSGTDCGCAGYPAFDPAKPRVVRHVEQIPETVQLRAEHHL